VTSALEGGEWSAPRPGRFTPGKDPVSIVQEAGWAPGPVWTGAKNLAPTGIFLFQNILLKLTVIQRNSIDEAIMEQRISLRFKL
jgi:hypothetical protein